MNARILKKLSKRSAPWLPLFGDHRKQFNTEEHGDMPWQLMRCDQKHLFRINGKFLGHGYFNSFKGTIAVGEMSGYYEPEWYDEPAYSALRDYLVLHFTNWEKHANNEDIEPTVSRRLHTPTDIFRAASDALDELLAEDKP